MVRAEQPFKIIKEPFVSYCRSISLEEGIYSVEIGRAMLPVEPKKRMRLRMRTASFSVFVFSLYLHVVCAGNLDSNVFALESRGNDHLIHFSNRFRIRREAPVCFLQGTKLRPEKYRSPQWNGATNFRNGGTTIAISKTPIETNKSSSQFFPKLFRSKATINQSFTNGQSQKSPKHAHSLHSNGEEKFSHSGMERIETMATSASNNFKIMMENRTDFEMAAASALALSLPTGVIITLAMNGDTPMESSETFVRDLTRIWNDFSVADGEDLSELLSTDGLELLEDGVQSLSKVSFNVFDAAVPTTAVDVLSIALGEAIAGAIGGIATWGLGVILRAKNFRENMVQTLKQDNEAQKGNFKNLFSNEQYRGNGLTNGLVTEAVADTDYFLTRAAATPLLGAVGLSPGAASLISVFVASVPYQFIKLSRRQRENREREDRLLEALLQNEKMKQKPLYKYFRIKTPIDLERESENERKINPTLTDDITAEIKTGSANKIDLVELFADVTKWLEYDVLSKDFAGSLKLNNSPINSGVESAAFGFMAALSSQIYADVIYRFTDYGLKSNRLASRNKSLQDRLNFYSIKCLTAATLFGTYETVRLPISSFIVNLLSGGVDSCLGSNDFNLCLETYMFDNPAEASTEAQFRSLIVAAMNLIERVNLDVSNENVNMMEMGRSLSVQIYSIFLRFS